MANDPSFMGVPLHKVYCTIEHEGQTYAVLQADFDRLQNLPSPEKIAEMVEQIRKWYPNE